jgi:hypothetical protein
MFLQMMWHRQRGKLVGLREVMMICLTEVVAVAVAVAVANAYLLFTRAMRIIGPGVDLDADLIRFRKDQSDKK